MDINTNLTKRIINVHDFTRRDLPSPLIKLSKPVGNPGMYKHMPDYYDCVCAFDIETTYLKEYDESIMYIWQFAFENVCVYGRTWDEYKDFLAFLSTLPHTFVVFVHNLSFEFQFLAGVFSFPSDNVFAVKSRKVLKATYANIEYRCSYIHSNMSLDKYIKSVGGEYQKLELDYSVTRYPWTVLSDKELDYCVNDVIGLTSAIRAEMKKDGDNLYTIPLTSTGYLRREAKRALQNWRPKIIAMRADYDLQCKLKAAFRGGDTHANRRCAGHIIENVYGSDRSSSYPDVMVNCDFPMSAFMHIGYMTEDELNTYLGRKALLITVAFGGLELRDDLEPCPYISLSKCQKFEHVICDNGRVMIARYAEMAVTDVDWRIIKYQYKAQSTVILDVYVADYKKLPKPLTDLMIEYYRKKTALKGDREQEYYYIKSKNKLNSGYGMCAQDPMPDSIEYREEVEHNGGFVYTAADPEKWDDAKNRYWLSYAWGVWVTAWARYRLHEGRLYIKKRGGMWVYGDTDSNKYTGDVDWTEYNRERIKHSLKNGAFADDSKGNRHYMGVYESEGKSDRFITWGAKKYAYTDKEGLHITVAGVGKKAGAKELVKAARISRHLTGGKETGLDLFKPSYRDEYGEKHKGFVFIEGGGTESRYDDTIDLTVNIDGHDLRITRNVSIVPSTYELSLTQEYRDLIRYQVINGTEDVLNVYKT